MPITRVKICCIATPEEARVAIQLGSSALGLVSAMPSGPGPIPEAQISLIARMIPPSVGTFLLTSSQDAPSIIEQHRRCGTDTLQLVDAVPPNVYAELRESLPGIKIVQVVHVLSEESVEEAALVSRYVDAILLDSGNPRLPVKELGGTGRRHNWNISKTIRETVAVPVFLAGGLNSVNVREAIETVRPFAVDVCSGVRTQGALDVAKLQEFFTTVQGTS